MPETFDLIVRGGEVVNQDGRGLADIGVRGGKVAFVGDLGQASAGEVFDARGLTILPGVIDSQVHFREPGLEWKEDLESGSRGAVLGGVTTVFEMPNTEPTTTDADALADKLARAKGRMHSDHAFYIGGTHENATFLGELERLPGCCGVKVFMGASTGSLLVPDDPGVEADPAPHQPPRRLPFRGRVPPGGTPTARPHRRLDQPPGGARRRSRFPLHPPAGRPRQAARQAHPRPARDHRRGDRLPFRPQGRRQRRAHPPAPDAGGAGRLRAAQGLRPDEPAHPRGGPPRRAVAGLATGVADVLGSDHAPHTAEEKARPYPASPSGMPGVQTLLPIMLTHVAEGRLTLERLVDLDQPRPAAHLRHGRQGADGGGLRRRPHHRRPRRASDHRPRRHGQPRAAGRRSTASKPRAGRWRRSSAAGR